MKDIIDLALLIRSGRLALKRAADAMRLTFDRRQTHELPPALLKPPAEWQLRLKSWRKNANFRRHECIVR